MQGLHKMIHIQRQSAYRVINMEDSTDGFLLHLSSDFLYIYVIIVGMFIINVGGRHN